MFLEYSFQYIAYFTHALSFGCTNVHITPQAEADTRERQRIGVRAGLAVMESVSPQQSTSQVHYRLERDRWARWKGERRCYFKITNTGKHDR